MTDAITNLGYLAGATRFRRISEKLHADGNKIYEDNNIDFKASWFSVFYILAASGKPMTVLELAEEIGFTHITVKNVVREMESSQLVKINTHPSDKRSKHIEISAKGQKLFSDLKKVWVPFSHTLKHLLDAGHPDFLNIIQRIDKEISRTPIHEKIKTVNTIHPILVLDYKPSLKKYFYGLTGNWILQVTKGRLEEEDKFSLHNPDKAYLETGGFIFFALYKKKVVGCVALKRLNENTFEFAKLYVEPGLRNMGIATKLIERCITRCKENSAKQLWLQTTLSMPEAHRLYYKMGFKDKRAPKQMKVLERTEKIMVLELTGTMGFGYYK